MPDSAVPQGVLIDMDGTLIDSEPHWIAAEMALTREYGVSWTDEDARQLIGNDLTVSANILRAAGVRLTARQIITRLGSDVAAAIAAEVPWCEGARELLLALADADIPVAVVTASERFIAAPTIRAVGPLARLFVTGDDVTNGKPDPEAYRRAAELLGVDVTACVAIEDSPNGISSAMGAGARTIACPREVPIPPRRDLSRVASLAQVDLDLLARVAGGETIDLI